MINLSEIENTILDLEQRDTTYSVCERLAWLYIVRDHLSAPVTRTAAERELTEQYSGSDFLQAASGKPVDHVLRVIDEHMEAIRIIYPKEYDAIIQKLNNE